MVPWKTLVYAPALAISFSLALPSIALAQTFRGGINGIVTDSTGAVLPKAVVTATNEATTLTYKTTSSGAGVFFVPGLAAGDLSDRNHSKRIPEEPI
jgi:hypothetical protein